MTVSDTRQADPAMYPLMACAAYGQLADFALDIDR
jgi:hypothetical protein